MSAASTATTPTTQLGGTNPPPLPALPPIQKQPRRKPPQHGGKK